MRWITEDGMDGFDGYVEKKTMGMNGVDLEENG